MCAIILTEFPKLQRDRRTVAMLISGVGLATRAGRHARPGAYSPGPAWHGLTAGLDSVPTTLEETFVKIAAS
jgi:hypothetical protein